MASFDIKKVIGERVTANVVTIAIGGAVAWFIYDRFIKSDAKKRNKQETKDVDDELEEAKKKTKLSYPLSQYQAFAKIIEIAGQDAGTDEKAIYSVFRKLKNNADYLQLVKAWGVARQVYPEWIFFYSTGQKLSLQQFIRYEMDEKEVRVINNILTSKGIKYRI
jgi:hypothetical protein